MSHTCKALIIHCMDFRFNKGLFEFLNREGLLGDADIVGWAGSGKPFLDDDGRAFAMKQVELSHSLHHTTEVYLIHHNDCGGYGGSKKWDNDVEKEWKFQLGEMQKVRAIINERYPEIVVKSYMAVLGDDKNVAFTAVG